MTTNHEAAAARRVLSSWYADQGDVHRSVIQLSKAVRLEHDRADQSAWTTAGAIGQIYEGKVCGAQIHGVRRWTCALTAGHDGIFHVTASGDRWRVRYAPRTPDGCQNVTFLQRD